MKQIELAKDGTLSILTDENLDDVKRVLVTRKGSVYGGLYYPDEKQKGKWKRIFGYVTPGGDPVWCCSECGKGIHVYGVEHGSYGADIASHQWLACPNCGSPMEGEEDNGTD